MLILDKQKAVEHMVALTAGAADADHEPQTSRPRHAGRAGTRTGTRARQRVATFERRAVHLDAPATDAREPRPAGPKPSRGIAPA